MRTLFAVAARMAVASLPLLGPLASAPASAQELLEPGQAFRATARATDASTVTVRFDIAEGYYLYRNKFHFAFEPGRIAPAGVHTPPGQLKDDPFFGQVETYRNRVDVTVRLPQPMPGKRVTLLADSQGCADLGVCYPPFRQELALTLPASRTKGKTK